ncbi:MAG: hypothetical protein ACM3SY_06065 [Candidatus Omnitrophota bacterium]
MFGSFLMDSLINRTKEVREYSLHENYCLELTETLAYLCENALAGKDYDYLNTVFGNLIKEKKIIAAALSMDANNKFIYWNCNSFKDVFNPNTTFKESRNYKYTIAYSRYHDHNARMVLQTNAKLHNHGEKTKTFYVLFDLQLPEAQAEIFKDLKQKITTGGILFFLFVCVGMVLITFLMTREFNDEVSRIRYRELSGSLPPPILKPETVISTGKRYKTGLRWLSREEKAILKMASSRQSVRNILSQSPMSEMETYILLSKLIMIEVLKIDE